MSQSRGLGRRAPSLTGGAAALPISCDHSRDFPSDVTTFASSLSRFAVTELMGSEDDQPELMGSGGPAGGGRRLAVVGDGLAVVGDGLAVVGDGLAVVGDGLEVVGGGVMR